MTVKFFGTPVVDLGEVWFVSTDNSIGFRLTAFDGGMILKTIQPNWSPRAVQNMGLLDPVKRDFGELERPVEPNETVAEVREDLSLQERTLLLEYVLLQNHPELAHRFSQQPHFGGWKVFPDMAVEYEGGCVWFRCGEGMLYYYTIHNERVMVDQSTRFLTLRECVGSAHMLMQQSRKAEMEAIHEYSTVRLDPVRTEFACGAVRVTASGNANWEITCRGARYLVVPRVVQRLYAVLGSEYPLMYGFTPEDAVKRFLGANPELREEYTFFGRAIPLNGELDLGDGYRVVIAEARAWLMHHDTELMQVMSTTNQKALQKLEKAAATIRSNLTSWREFDYKIQRFGMGRMTGFQRLRFEDEFDD